MKSFKFKLLKHAINLKHFNFKFNNVFNQVNGII